jgi:hypothetical protein
MRRHAALGQQPFSQFWHGDIRRRLDRGNEEGDLVRQPPSASRAARPSRRRRPLLLRPADRRADTYRKALGRRTARHAARHRLRHPAADILGVRHDHLRPW